MNPRPIFIFYSIYIVSSPLNDGRQVKKLWVFITKFEPQFSGLLSLHHFTSEKPFREFRLKPTLHWAIFMWWLSILHFPNFLEERINFVLASAKHLLIPFAESISGYSLLFVQFDEFWSWNPYIPGVLNNSTAIFIFEPNCFKPKRPMSKTITWVCVQKDRGMVWLDSTQMGDGCFWVSQPPWDVCHPPV